MSINPWLINALGVLHKTCPFPMVETTRFQKSKVESEPKYLVSFGKTVVNLFNSKPAVAPFQKYLHLVFLPERGMLLDLLSF